MREQLRERERLEGVRLLLRGLLRQILKARPLKGRLRVCVPSIQL